MMTQQMGTGLLTLWDQLWRGGREQTRWNSHLALPAKGGLRKIPSMAPCQQGNKCKTLALQVPAVQSKFTIFVFQVANICRISTEFFQTYILPLAFRCTIFQPQELLQSSLFLFPPPRPASTPLFKVLPESWQPFPHISPGSKSKYPPCPSCAPSSTRILLNQSNFFLSRT